MNDMKKLINKKGPVKAQDLLQAPQNPNVFYHTFSQNASMELIMDKKYGDFNNVLLTDEEYKKLSEKFSTSLEEKINDLSYYLESKPVKYKSHYAVILNWARRDARKLSSHPIKGSGFNNFENKEKSDFDDIRKKSLERLLKGAVKDV